MITVSRLVTCDKLTASRPHTLRRVRRSWRSPPANLGIYIEFMRMRGDQEFDWTLRILRGRLLILESAPELELAGSRYVEAALNLPITDFDAKTYRLEVLINDVPASSTMLDCGSVEASP